MFSFFTSHSSSSRHKFTEFKPREPTLKQGHLSKKGSLNRWKQKYFIVQNETLFEFSSPKDLSSYSRIDLTDTVVVPVDIKKKPFAFTISRGSSVVITLRAESDDAMLDWVSILVKAAVAKIAKAPPVPSKPLPPPPPSARGKKKDDPQSILERRIARVQATWRARKQRKIYLEILKLSKHRLRIVNELLETERSYLGYLAIMIEIYQKPMIAKAQQPVTKQNPQLITPEDITKIFSDVEIIYNIHRMLRMELEERIQNWFPQQKLAPVFNYLISSMKSYAQYVNNYDTAISVLESYKAKPAFAAFLEEAAKNSGLQVDLFALLIMPVQRPPRLCMLLRDLLNKTWSGHQDEGDLREAVGQMEAVTTFLNESKRQAENRNKVFSIQQRLQETGRENVLELLQPHRNYIAEGSLLQIRDNNQKERYVFLFNDILLISRKVAVNKGGLMAQRRQTVRFVVDHTKQAVVSLERYSVVESLPDTKHVKNAFAILASSSVVAPGLLVPPLLTSHSTPSMPLPSRAPSTALPPRTTSTAVMPARSSSVVAGIDFPENQAPKPLKFACETAEQKQVWMKNIEIALNDLALKKQQQASRLTTLGGQNS